MHLDAPKGLRSAAAITDRRALLAGKPDGDPLTIWRERWQATRAGSEIPHFDPAEAGLATRVLLVLEAPGRKAAVSSVVGSGFISVDNDDDTAANLWRARNDVGLHHGVLMTNISPWFLGPASIKPSPLDQRQGAAALRELMTLLVDLKVVVLMGLNAQRAWDRNIEPAAPEGVTVLRSWHTSPQVLNSRPTYGEDVRKVLVRARDIAGAWPEPAQAE